ncbi:ABC-F family ATP-binding cassette domain-containing protein [Blastomonas sp.]|uniref:ABC-F family ATP-binding cassette domain-containing protein n=1 Tax=Blastomonas sp. TaxID=1909299 RepID=UPI003592EC05
MLQFNDLTVRLGGHTILDHATAALPTGSRVGLIGRNGAGKSTLMKALVGLIEPDTGSIQFPKDARIGYLKQDAPDGDVSVIETVLAADLERARLMHEAEATADPEGLAAVHERLAAIESHSAPARAARILAGLGFDEEMQARALDSYSGGWKMRVALAGLLFSDPDIMLLDEPSNHLDLEATLWLEDFLKSCRATMLVISHERDLLNHVADHILHLDHGRLTLYQGDYDSFERQRSERQLQAAAARERQLSERAKLQSFVDRWRAKSHTAKQAQSRMKALARMEPVAAKLDDPTLAFDFPNADELKPPLITLDDASVGYTPGAPILRLLNLRIDPEDRIALLGKNGNGKTTLARLLAGQLQPEDGAISMAGRIRVGYFTQYQVEELDRDSSPLEHMARLMPGAPPKAVRGQLGRFGFSGDKATMSVGLMSGGERARLALALITRDAPHLLILDEPTNHLDVDTREALVQALNAFSGAVIIVSHDRHMLELTADRLVLVDNGRATAFDGSLEDYTAMVLGKDKGGKGQAGKPEVDRKEKRRIAAELRQRQGDLRKRASACEKQVAKLEARCRELDRAMFDPSSASPLDAALKMSELMQLRATTATALEAAEAEWLELSEAVEGGEVA